MLLQLVLMSDELDLDELECVGYMVDSHGRVSLSHRASASLVFVLDCFVLCRTCMFCGVPLEGALEF